MFSTDPIASRIDIEEDILAQDFNQPVILKVKSVYQGNAADVHRYQFQNMTLDNIKRSYLEYFSRYYNGISVESAPRFEDDTVHNRFTVYETYRIDDYWKHENSVIYSKIYNLSYIEALRTPKVKQRQTPYFLGSPRQVNSVFRLHYPQDVLIKLDEKPVNISNPALNYSYQDLYADGVYTHRSSLNVRQKNVALADVDVFLQDLEEIHKDWEYTLTVKDPNGLPGLRELQTLKQHLKQLAGKAHE